MGDFTEKFGFWLPLQKNQRIQQCWAYIPVWQQLARGGRLHKMGAALYSLSPCPVLHAVPTFSLALFVFAVCLAVVSICVCQPWSIWKRCRIPGFGIRSPLSSSYLPHWGGDFWRNHVASLGLSILICQMGLKIIQGGLPVPQNYSEDQKW